MTTNAINIGPTGDWKQDHNADGFMFVHGDYDGCIEVRPDLRGGVVTVDFHADTGHPNGGDCFDTFKEAADYLASFGRPHRVDTNYAVTHSRDGRMYVVMFAKLKAAERYAGHLWQMGKDTPTEPATITPVPVMTY